MPRARARNQTRRTFIPDEYLRMLGLRILHALQTEHIRHDDSRKRRSRFSVERACTATGIPFATMNAYTAGKRQPSILDMHMICQFSGATFEELMSVIPSRKELDQLFDQQKREAREEAKRRQQAGDDDEEEEQDG
jgi:transcriptional regulator with XRE-family HTH domain